MNHDERTFDIDELASLAGLPRRTVRYYIQEGLVDRPEGSRKGATYGSRHLEQLLAIRRWRDSGLSLERIRQLLAERAAPSEGIEKSRGPGTVEVVTRVIVSEGVEILLEPRASGLSPEQVRMFISEVAAVYNRISSTGDK
ncbi:MerR family transcriptional regulator [Fundidesulfovibrio soli]|uniref:MerR family transcriptional regulator n=1 Tax=Fundidesulfovibrio soli TaxID=2922716 RepID=UPI001FAF6AE5|nr:MerR family transcriptional regulator [Fundidesulfovibrio soli]